MTLVIAYLADAPHHLPQLAAWMHEEWGALTPGGTVESMVEKLRPRMQRRALPCAFVATDGGRLAGSASLVERDMMGHPEWSPWLAGVYVHGDFRGRGIASALSERVADEARSLGVPTLYLHTTDRQRLYARLGWRADSEDDFRDMRVTLMSLDLASR